MDKQAKNKHSKLPYVAIAAMVSSLLWLLNPVQSAVPTMAWWSAISPCILPAPIPAARPATANAVPPSNAIARELPGRNRIIDQWIPVPDWLAGTWQASEETLLASYNCVTRTKLSGLPQKVQINRTSKIGAQRDNQGAIWHAGGPYLRVIDTASYTEYQYLEKVMLMSTSPTSVIVGTSATVSRVSKYTNQVMDRFREETMTTYTPLEDGLIIADFFINDFDDQGNSLYSSRAMCTEQRIQPFSETDTDERGNLKLMFQEYLRKSGQSALIPADH